MTTAGSLDTRSRKRTGKGSRMIKDPNANLQEMTPAKSSQLHVTSCWNGRRTVDLPLITSGSSKTWEPHQVWDSGPQSKICRPVPYFPVHRPQPGAPSYFTTSAAAAPEAQGHAAPCAMVVTIGPGLTAHQDRGPAPGTTRWDSRASHFFIICSKETAGCWAMSKVRCDDV